MEIFDLITRKKRIISEFFRHYVTNHIISKIPSYTIRHWYYRNICRYHISRGASVHMGVFFTGRKIKIGANTPIGRRSYIDGRAQLTIGENVSISPDVQIITAQHDINDPSFKLIKAPVTIEDYVWIGTRALILPGIHVGKGAVIAAGAVVTRDVPPFTVVGGVPAKPIKKRNQDLRYSTEWKKLFD